MGKKITIYDLAKKLGVSPATVSRSLSNHPSISTKTKERVVAKANELGYQTNKNAVNLSQQKSHSLGVIVPRLNSYFMSTVLAGMEKVVSESGYNLIISQSFESVDKERLNAQALYNSGVDALLVSLAYDTTNYDHFSRFIRSKIPLIFFDRVHHLANYATIVIDNLLAGFEATEHLIAQGCKNIVYIGGNLKRNVYSDRLQGYKNALAASGLSFKKKYVFISDLNPEKIADAIAHIKEIGTPIDGIFVANDNFAAYCMKELIKEGYQIPDDLKIIGFNNDPISELVSPTLSSINYPGYQMGILAGQSVIGHLNGNIDLQSANSISLRHQLIIRESSTYKQ